MLMFKTNDDISQIKRFILVYYEPLLSKLDIEQLNEALKNYQASPQHQQHLASDEDITSAERL